MKVVLFCGGLGTRIREYSENIPKPMVPIGHHPILWHVMNYYSQYGHRDFVLCLGYKANVVRDYFLTVKRWTYSDVKISDFGRQVEVLGEAPPDWRVSLVDTGIWRNIGERLVAVKNFLKEEEMFLANYSDGLTDAPANKAVSVEELASLLETEGDQPIEQLADSIRVLKRGRRPQGSDDDTAILIVRVGEVQSAAADTPIDESLAIGSS